MSGKSNSIIFPSQNTHVEIFFEGENYNIGRHQRNWSDSEKMLMDCTGHIQKVFNDIKISVKKSIHLDEEECLEYLVRLAEWGSIVHNEFFDDKMRNILANRFNMLKNETPAPTFVSEKITFPWEALYQGDYYADGDPKQFWGFQYAPARILTPDKDISFFASEHSLPLDMIFCLYYLLSKASQQELPNIERLIKAFPDSRFDLLSKSTCFPCRNTKDEELLSYLDDSKHNIIHFACHCHHTENGPDALLISLTDNNRGNDTPLEEIKLGAYTFARIRRQFLLTPLVFLNACQSAGGGDELRDSFNLPRMFVKRGAAAVIATACAVPDIFASAFARQFYKFFIYGKEVSDSQGKNKRILNIGEALKETRQYFLEKYNNPLGLAYGLYSPAYYRLARPPYEEKWFDEKFSA
ncbi:MAG: CHAT domain-containing protein [Desulfobacterales bacterium]|nr:CHAT domain-containing protein [Desulfobacterales bacterium]